MRSLHRLVLGFLLFTSLTACLHYASSQADDVEAMPAPQIFLEPEERAVLPEGVTQRKVSDKGLALTASQEGWRSKLYNDAAGYCTIGYGHLVKMKRCDGTEPPNFLKGLSKAEGLKLLSKDMGMAESAVTRYVKTTLTDGQYAALCDFTFNVGPGRLKKSTLLVEINAGNFDRVPTELRRYVKAGGKVLNCLVQRREKEIALFFEGLPVPRAAPAEGGPEMIDILEPLVDGE